MRDFLLKDKRSSRNGVELPDILASDYLPAGFARTWTLPTWETEWQDEMDKQLAHITFEREKKWEHWKWVPKLEAEMRTAWSAFLAAITDPAQKTEFTAQISHCQGKQGFANVRL